MLPLSLNFRVNLILLRKRMLQPHHHLLPLFITFIFFSCWILDGVVSDPQIYFLTKGCNPYYEFLVSNVSIFEQIINATLRDIREQISDQNKHFATAQEASNGGNTVSALFQCRSYLSVADCVACFDVAAPQILSCAAGDPGGHVAYDGCYLRYDISSGFFGDTTQFINSASCGNQTTEEPVTAFTSAVQQMLMNLQKATPGITGFSAATKTQVPNNGSTIYGFAQCIETIIQSKCEDCLNAQYNNMQACLPNSEGRAYANGCFMRYSTTSFFPDNHTMDITTPSFKQGSSNKGAIIGGIVGSLVAVALIFLVSFIWIRRRLKRPRRVPRGDITGASKLKGPAIYEYKDLKTATKNFSEENKLGEGGFGVVYRGTLRDGKDIAVKKLTFHHFTKMEEDFENEVKLISNVHHRNLVRLLGYCIHDKNRILVYEYMKNSSLDVFLFGQMRGSLNWKQRYDIILGIAKGLAYLHEDFHICIIHRDIKPNNILLDEVLEPKIADFGLARLLPHDKSHLSTKFAGTLGYIAPEYLIHGQLSEKADVYSYGVVILEIISGQKSKELRFYGDGDGEFLLQKAWKLYEKGAHVELVDNTLDPMDYEEEEVKKVIQVGLLCTQASTEIRPTMSEVVNLLQNKDLSENMVPTMPVLIETN